MLGQYLLKLQKRAPLIHNITNYVTVNDCANILLAAGASPIMADDINEAAQITSICGGLNINIGTLNERTIVSMLAAGKRSNELGHPVLLDPVGAGASTLRTNTANELLREIKFSVIRGNISEIKTLALGSHHTQGVDAHVDDIVTEQNLNSVISFAKSFAKQTNAVIAITGAIDIVANHEKAYVIRNGHPKMSKITGTGCMLSAMTTAYITASPDAILEATAAAVCAMGLCGQFAHAKMQANQGGNASFRMYLIDAIDNLTADTLDEGALYEIR